MTAITKDNLISFMDYYHWFHDSYIIDVKYEFKKGQIELYFDIYWSGIPTLKDVGNYETNRKNLKMVCKGIYQYNYKENYTDYIDISYLKFIKINKEEYICFATSKEEPLITVACKSIEYEELKSI